MEAGRSDIESDWQIVYGRYVPQRKKVLLSNGMNLFVATLTLVVLCLDLLPVKTRYRQVVFKVEAFVRNLLDSFPAQEAKELELCGTGVV